VLLFPNLQDLLLRQASETEHSNLVDNVVPVARRLQLIKLALERLAHRNDTTTHLAKILFPLGKQLLVVENARCDTSTIRRRVTDLGTLENGKLTANTSGSIDSLRGSTRHKVEAACTLAVKTKVLCVTLSDKHLKALLDKVANSPGILVQVARRKTLVCAVEEGKLRSTLHERGNLFPLILCRVHSSGVVCASVQQDNTAFRCLLYRLHHALKVKTLCLCREIWVVLDAELDIGKDLVVVGPGRVGDVNGLCLGVGRIVKLGQEGGTQVDGASARDGLQRDGTLLLESGRVGAEDESLRCGGKVGETGNWQVFVVQVWVLTKEVICLCCVSCRISLALLRYKDQTHLLDDG
jgi:hypothetical protein